MSNQPKKVESVLIKKLILEDETGARVAITIPRGLPLQEGGILRSLSMGAIRTGDIINDFKKARMKAAELQAKGVEGSTEVAFGDKQEKLVPIDPFDPAAQVQAALANADPPPVFVGEGEERKFCTCEEKYRVGARRCLHCGLLIETA